MGKYTIIETPTFTVENTEPHIGELKLTSNLDYTGFNSNVLIVDFGDKQREGSLKENLLFKNKMGFNDIDVTSVSASCGCTTPGFRLEGDGTLLTIGLSLKSMSVGNNEKYIKVVMRDKRVMKIKIRVNGL